MWGKVSCLRKRHDGSSTGVESPTFRSEVQRTNHRPPPPLGGALKTKKKLNLVENPPSLLL